MGSPDIESRKQETPSLAGRWESLRFKPSEICSRSISQKAAALVQAVSGGHGFVDGNKRTALILMDLLTQRSGYELIPLADDGDFETVVEDLVVDLECHRLTLGQVVTWFEARLRRIE